MTLGQFILLSWIPVGFVSSWYMSRGLIRQYKDLFGMIVISVFGYILLAVILLIILMDLPFWNKKLPWVK